MSTDGTPELFVLVESNTTGTGRLFARAARACGLAPVLLAGNPARYPYIVEDGIRAEMVDTSNNDALVDCIAGIAKNSRLRGIATSSEYFTVTAARLAQRFDLPGPDPHALESARCKSDQYAALQRAKVPVPAFAIPRHVEESERAIREIGLPCVIKPSTGTGSIDVRRFDDLRTAQRHCEQLMRARVNERGMRVDPGAVVMRYVAGDEYSAEIFSGEVIGITRKHLSPEPAFLEVGHDFPARLPADRTEPIAQCAVDAVRALGLSWGPAHVELRWAAEGPVIIEVNGRLAGGMIPELVREAQGIDLIASAVRLACGLHPDLIPRHEGAASIRFVAIRERGRFIGVDGLDKVKACDGVVAAGLSTAPGTFVESHGDFRDRVAHVIATADDVESAARRADEAVSRLMPIVEADRRAAAVV